VQAPRVPFLPPNICEATLNWPTGYEPGARCVGKWDHRLKPHHDSEVTINPGELDCSLKGREIDDSTPDEGIQVTPTSDDYSVVGGVDRKLLGPQLLERWNVAVQGRNTLPIVERANGSFIRDTTLAQGSGTRDNE
jgi:hypothetical protein